MSDNWRLRCGFCLETSFKVFNSPSHAMTNIPRQLGYYTYNNILHVVDLRRRRIMLTTVRFYCNHPSYPEYNAISDVNLSLYCVSCGHTISDTLYTIDTLWKEVLHLKYISHGNSRKIEMRLKMKTYLVTGVTALFVIREITAIETAGFTFSCSV